MAWLDHVRQIDIRDDILNCNQHALAYQPQQQIVSRGAVACFSSLVGRYHTYSGTLRAWSGL